MGGAQCGETLIHRDSRKSQDPGLTDICSSASARPSASSFLRICYVQFRAIVISQGSGESDLLVQPSAMLPLTLCSYHNVESYEDRL